MKKKLKEKLLTCTKCSMVHYGISREEAQEHVDDFNEHFDDLTIAQQEYYYDSLRANIASFEHCKGCGSIYKSFRPFEARDMVDEEGLMPIIKED